MCLLIACGGGDSTPDATPLPDGAPVGRECVSGVSDPGAPTSYNTPAPECPQPDRLCLHVEGTDPDLCAARCEDERGCAKVFESPCLAFTCIAPFDVGMFACQKLCVCSDYVPDGGFGTFCPM